MSHYYNELDAHAADWLANLGRASLIPAGAIDRRSITEVRPDDLGGYRQCHFFAGIGGWPFALGLAGWPESRPVWTASCPCQPFSSAGKGKGEADERHLWPVLLALVRECRPHAVFGEQVASADGVRWLDRVRADVEAEGYRFGAADLPACCAGAPHVRQRLFWVADLPGRRLAEARGAGGRLADAESQRPRGAGAGDVPQPARRRSAEPGDGRRLGDADGRRRAEGHAVPRRGAAGAGVSGAPLPGRVGDSLGDGLQGEQETRPAPPPALRAGRAGVGFWDDHQWLDCLDGKRRRVEPGTFPLAHGVPFRLACGTAGHGSRRKALRGIGNAIVPEVACLFVRAYLDAEAAGEI